MFADIIKAADLGLATGNDQQSYQRLSQTYACLHFDILSILCELELGSRA